MPVARRLRRSESLSAPYGWLTDEAKPSRDCIARRARAPADAPIPDRDRVLPLPAFVVSAGLHSALRFGGNEWWVSLAGIRFVSQLLPAGPIGVGRAWPGAGLRVGNGDRPAHRRAG